MDYITARLTGRVTRHAVDRVRATGVRQPHLGRHRVRPRAGRGHRARPRKLAPLVPLNGVVGEVTAAVAAELGIAPGTPVVPGTIDSITSAVGTGALGPETRVGHHRHHLGARSPTSPSTAATSRSGILSVPSPVPGMYYVMAENGLGGRAFEWAQRLFGYDSPDTALGDAATVAAGSRRRAVPAVAARLDRAQPERRRPRARSSGLSLQHERRHAMRATLEGVALNLAWLLPHVEAFVGNRVPVPPLRRWRRAEPAVGADPRRRHRPAGAPPGRAARHQRPRRGIPRLRRPRPRSTSPTCRRCCRCNRSTHPNPHHSRRRWTAHSPASSLSTPHTPCTEGATHGPVPLRRPLPRHPQLPRSRADRASEILAEIEAMAEVEDSPYHEGKISGSIYSGDEEHYEFLNEVFGHYSHANVHPARHVPERHPVRGRDHRDDGRHAARRRGAGAAPLRRAHQRRHREPDEPAARLPRVGPRARHHLAEPGHAGHRAPGARQGRPLLRHRAAQGSGHRPVRRRHGRRCARWSTRTPSRSSARPAPTRTVWSTPSSELSDLALERGINLHVDGCLGGFILAWGKDLGYDVPSFDFRLPGVTSISADTHKYGFGLKGSSVLLYRNPELRRLQYFIVPDWPGGAYTSPGMSGSRSGGIIAAAWAAMVSLGREGYMAIAARHLPHRRRICRRPSRRSPNCGCWATRSSTSRSPPPTRAASTSSWSTTSWRRDAGG